MREFLEQVEKSNIQIMNPIKDVDTYIICNKCHQEANISNSMFK